MVRWLVQILAGVRHGVYAQSTEHQQDVASSVLLSTPSARFSDERLEFLRVRCGSRLATVTDRTAAIL